MTTASKITLIRVAFIPVFIALMYMGERGTNIPMMLASLAVFIIASLTDYVDGYIARKYNQVSDFGKFLDPLADKLLTIAAMTVFCEWGSFPAWALMIVLTREFAVTGLRLVAVGKGKVIAAGWSGKVKTASTMIGLCFMIAFPTIDWLGGIVVAVIVITTVYSGGMLLMEPLRPVVEQTTESVPLSTGALFAPVKV
jgi:CDP-diacylglycerol--glycerol-3-phosphate 3-phosphatidyltransferase